VYVRAEKGVEGVIEVAVAAERRRSCRKQMRFVTNTVSQNEQIIKREKVRE
jgi:hypothetical protein